LVGPLPPAGPGSGVWVKKGAKPGTAYIHHAIDDHSRLVYSEILSDERKETALAFWARANNYFNGCGITVLRVLTDNGSVTGRDRSRHLTVSLSSLATEQRWLTRPPRTSMTPHRRSADRTCTVFEIDAVAGSARDGSLKPCGGAPLP
jgi:Integrase core domain